MSAHGNPEEALAELAGFSMVKWETGNQAFRIHRLVRDAVRERLPREQRDAILHGALWMVNDYLPGDPPPDVRSWPIWEMMVAHVRELISAAIQSRIGRPTRGLANELGVFVAEKSLWPEDESLARLALEIDVQMLGSEHPDVAVRLNNRAQLLRATNRLSEAEQLAWQALAIDGKSYGPEHPNVAIRLNNLAVLLKATDRLSEAESLSRRQLQIFAEFGRKTGHKHPHFRTALENYVVLLKAMGMSEDEVRDRVLSAM
jgi:hypothetical protein